MPKRKRNTRRLSINETIRAVQELQNRTFSDRSELIEDEIIRKQKLLRMFDKKQAESLIRAKTKISLSKLIKRAIKNDKEWNALNQYLKKYAMNRKSTRPIKDRITSKTEWFKLSWVDDAHRLRSISGPYRHHPQSLSYTANRTLAKRWWIFDDHGECVKTIVNSGDLTLEHMNKELETTGITFRFKSWPNQTEVKK